MIQMFEAVNDFILKFAPGVVQDNIYRGYFNRASLPDVQDYTVISVSDTSRVGTNIGDDAQAADNIYTTKALYEYTIDIDFVCDDQMTAHKRASALATLGRDYIAVDFFKGYAIGFNYADDMAYLPFVDLSDQYIHRYRVTLHLTQWESVSTSQEYAEKVEINLVENIDAHHKQKKE